MTDCATWLQVCWIPIFKAKKLILAGDPMQLPPTILAVDKKRKKKAGKTEKAKGRVNGLQKAQTPKLQKNVKPPKTSEPLPAASKDETEMPPDSASSEAGDGGDSSGSDDDAENDVVASADTTRQAKTRSDGARRTELHVPRSLETTLFDRLEKMYGPGIKRMLNVQYRYVLSLHHRQYRRWEHISESLR